VDTLVTDPLAALNLTANGFSRLIQEIKSWGIKWVALGGGGYNIMNVARAWTKAWSIMKGVDIPDALPESFITKHQLDSEQNLTLSDPVHKLSGGASDNAWKLAEQTVARIKGRVFPILGV
jgi:acetoin utilization protein AcuC